MRFAAPLLALAAALLAATPAAATQGQLCRPVAGDGPVIAIVIGSPGIAGATILDGDRTRTTTGDDRGLALRQSWIDPDRLWIDFTDRGFMTDEGRLRLQPAGAGRSRAFAGSFARGGRVYRMRCEET
jgi:hypothetical protein